MLGSTRHNHGYSIEKVQESAEFIKSKISILPKIGIICGSGLSGLGDIVKNKVVLQYKDIPSFVESTVPGHKGQLVVGQISGKNVVCMQGRFHPYEGYEPWVVGFPVRVMKLLGVEVMFVTNAAGGLNPDFTVGDIMLIKDHISFFSMGGYNPLTGPNDNCFGPRFPSLLNAYDKTLRDLVKECMKELKIDKYQKEGVYCNVSGPSYETIAEIRMLRSVGGDSVGMSTVQEVITARHCGIKVVACSLITNECVTEYDTDATVGHEEVLETSKARAKALESLVTLFIKKLTL